MSNEGLSAQVAAMGRGQRCQAAYFALRRLRGPLVGMAMPEEWGVDPAALAELLRAGADVADGGSGAEFARAVAALTAAPLFESEIEPEFAESFQLEALNGWLMLADALGEMSEADTERIIDVARATAVYLDDYMAGSLTEVAGEETRERWLADVDESLRVYGLGYFGTRNLAVEAECHDAVLAAPAGADLLTSAVRQRLEESCDAYSEQLAAVLRGFAAQ
ncbi:hypothetical protein ACIO6U_06600 [Streptomyces sp. NPDC087422]|uniref:hypothetical protein n=1 Tax=Streptomyces sp. NPDC087422 TaxID=3365786 RepID=UPI0037FECAD0